MGYASALDVLPAAEAARQFRLPDLSAGDMSDVIEQSVRAAVAEIERRTGAPLVDRRESLLAKREDCDAATDPIYIVGASNWTAEVTAVAYWLPAGQPTRGAAPATYMASWGELRKIPGSRKNYNLWPPAGGWPASVDNAYLIEMRYGLDGVETADLKQAVIVAARSNFHGTRMPAEERVIEDICAGWTARA